MLIPVAFSTADRGSQVCVCVCVREREREREREIQQQAQPLFLLPVNQNENRNIADSLLSGAGQNLYLFLTWPPGGADMATEPVISTLNVLKSGSD